MTAEKLLEVYDVQPFHPFTLHLADGRAITVRHREFMATAPAARTVVVFRPNGRMNIIDLELVTDVELRPSFPQEELIRRPSS
jgi:hypothetical protein